jgi:hypothetical protein
MASSTDLVRNATPNFATTLANSMLISDTTMTLSSVTGLPTATGITLVIDATDPVSGASTPALKEVVTGVVSGSTVTTLSRGLDGTSATAHASGANVVMWITANLWNDWQTSYLTEHTQAGRHSMTSPTIITNIKDTNGNAILGISPTGSAVNDLQIANSATGNAPTLSAVGSDTNINVGVSAKGTGFIQSTPPIWQYLGYAQITSNATQTSGSATAITGLSVGVTIPTGAIKVRVTLFSGVANNNTAGDYCQASIWSGATSGTLTTQLQSATIQASATAGQQIPMNCVYVSNSAPTPGATFFTAALNAVIGGTALLSAAATAPCFLLIECC